MNKLLLAEGDDRVVVFIERLEKTGRENRRPIYSLRVDFTIDPQSMVNFIGRTGLTFPPNRSMLEVNNVSFEKFGTPREGSFYELPEAFITSIEWIPVGEDEEFGATYLAFKSSYQIPLFFELALNYRSFIENTDSPDTSELNNMFSSLFDSLTNRNINIGVYNVGQGNWNEISFDDQIIITYDFGSSSSQVLGRLLQSITRTSKVRIILEKINRQEIKKVLIISHWDTDHYIGLNSLTDAQIQLFDCCIAPARIENETTKRVYNRLFTHSKVIPITMNKREIGTGHAYRLTNLYDSNILKVYKGTECSNRNKRGLVLSVHAEYSDFVFSGDHHYEQIDQYVNPNCNNAEYNIVIPHHGGNAGDYTLLDNINNGSDAIISTGGRYNHPLPKVETSVNKNFIVYHNTQYQNHYSKII